MRSRLSFKYLVIICFLSTISIGCFYFRDWNRGFDGVGGIISLVVKGFIYSNLEKKYLKKSVKRKEKKITLDWDNCTVNLVGRLGNGKTRLVLRTRTNRNSSYMGNKPVRLRFMLGIDISHLS